MSRIMVALGGNALGNDPIEQLMLVKETAKPIADLIEAGHSVVISHGNGPQVGMINYAFEVGSKASDRVPEMGFPECGAMSQGYIGYHLQSALRNELILRGIDKQVATILTEVIVDKDDSAFSNPTKPVGGFYSEDDAKKLESELGYTMIEDSGRGYRRVVPSPKPIGFVELEVIRTVVSNDHVVIASGGGGVPVILKNGMIRGIPAVIDKDFASEKLAELLDCDTLFILTAVDNVSLNYGKPNQNNLSRVTVRELKEYADAGHFAPGSMLPKVIAAMEFAQSKTGRRAIIGSLDKAKEALEGKSGTIIEG
ncbi:MAG: carbamate kinase [Gudongella sp.]|nr:carbamate kinase [Gudongella sp.]